MTFHMWCGTKMWVFLRDRRSICCGWIVTPVVPRTVNDVFADCNGCACLRVGDLKSKMFSWGRMSLRTAATKRRENRKGILYVLRDCKWLCLLSVGDMDSKMFSSGRMFLRTAATKTREDLKSNIGAIPNTCRCKHNASHVGNPRTTSADGEQETSKNGCVPRMLCSVDLRRRGQQTKTPLPGAIVLAGERDACPVCRHLDCSEQS